MLAFGLAALILLFPAVASAQTWPMGRFGGTPTCSVAGGGSCAITSPSWDSGGEMTLSGVVTAATLTFSTTYSPALRCLWTVGGITLPSIAFGLPSTTAATITAVLTGGTLQWFCFTR